MNTAVDPLALLGQWLPGSAVDHHPVMALSTIGDDGYPDARSVLLSAFDGSAVYFHTDIRSRKATQLAANPRVALVLAWPELGRQVTLQGDAQLTSREQAADAYATSSRYLQLLAWLNTPEIAVLPEDARHARWAEFSTAHPDGALPVPATWIGYRVVPRRITFWRGDTEGPSTRVEYERAGADWVTSILPG